MNHQSQSRQPGFTLVELLIVITIIGILISLILVAANDGVRRAEERATLSLITKLDTAVNDRYDALLNSQVSINQTHRYLAAINTKNASNNYIPVGTFSNNSEDRRAQVIAQFDFLRAELPDVFFLNAMTKDGTSMANYYPINFAAAPYPAGSNTVGSFVLPLGNNSVGLPFDLNTGAMAITQPQLPTTGMFGASFSSAGGLYKNLYTAAAADLIKNNPTCSVNIGPGFDGVDNNNDGLIDELTSSNGNASEVVVTGTPDKSFASYVAARLTFHTHNTARSEMLYAILVDGLGPLGSAYSREDFTSKEVQDTDGDGLPEFVDAWGQPLQFYRWPIYYGGTSSNGTVLGSSDSQRGPLQYSGFSETREQDPLDTNQLLLSPAWWFKTDPSATLTSPAVSTFAPPGSGSNTNQCSQGANGFMNYFHILVDPYAGSSTGTSWDRGGGYNRRAFFSRFLILSGGPDLQTGTAQLAQSYNSGVTSATAAQFTFPDGNRTMESNALSLIYIENQAAVSDPTARTGWYLEIPDTSSAITTLLQTSATLDDITNHNIQGVTTGVR